MTLNGIRRTLLTMVGFLFIILIGSQILLGNVMDTEFGVPVFFAALLFIILAEIVQRVELRLKEVEDKLKNHESRS